MAESKGKPRKMDIYFLKRLTWEVLQMVAFMVLFWMFVVLTAVSAAKLFAQLSR